MIRYIFTDRVRSTREGYVLTRVCPSICLSTPWGGEYPSQVQVRGDTQARSRWGGYPSQVQAGRGYPSQVQAGRGVLQPGPGGRGTPPQVPPCWTWLGEYPTGWVPHLGYPPSDLAGGVPWWEVPLPLPIRPGWGVPQLGGGTPPISTCYTAIGMPLAFTQEGFLVINSFGSRNTWNILNIFLSRRFWHTGCNSFSYCTLLYLLFEASLQARDDLLLSEYSELHENCTIIQFCCLVASLWYIINYRWSYCWRYFMQSKRNGKYETWVNVGTIVTLNEGSIVHVMYVWVLLLLN